MTEMQNVYEVNGLPFWSEDEIRERDHLASVFAGSLLQMLRRENAAWHSTRIEAPNLMPRSLINSNYDDDDLFFVGDKLALRPETTQGSYVYAQWLLDGYEDRPPFIVWQAGKSFRREQDQVTKNMRLKEFYQQEFQCIYTEDTKNDYQAVVLPKLAEMFSLHLGRRTRVVESDRLPCYSLKTMDIEVELPHKWMEIASISVRTDFPAAFTYTTGKGAFSKKILVLEVAIGLCRCVYAKFLPKSKDD